MRMGEKGLVIWKRKGSIFVDRNRHFTCLHFPCNSADTARYKFSLMYIYELNSWEFTLHCPALPGPCTILWMEPKGLARVAPAANPVRGQSTHRQEPTMNWDHSLLQENYSLENTGHVSFTGAGNLYCAILCHAGVAPRVYTDILCDYRTI